ncbi:hypothetical protein Pryu01_02806 [Paraliobacillus ryukyuensis]|uniref:Uncharacterized protein n=1 Tax=Paraliobacillus ryukyuensis TaxID=200904 RepID=A0A366E6X4_9BACI|nr:hypothetical protein DES48_106149 [Paraliobacillus ryukyuensis]
MPLKKKESQTLSNSLDFLNANERRTDLFVFFYVYEVLTKISFDEQEGIAWEKRCRIGWKNKQY